MTRGACLLLLLLASWLWSMPALRVQGPPRLAVVASSAGETRAVAESDHVTLQSGMPEVPRAALLARLPAPHAAAYVARLGHELSPTVGLGDLREAVRRVQLRRRLPRLGADDPPWC